MWSLELQGKEDERKVLVKPAGQLHIDNAVKMFASGLKSVNKSYDPNTSREGKKVLYYGS